MLHIAVCSRVADYESLGTKLRLRTAIVVQPLTAFEVQGYLERIGEPAHAVCAALKEDPSFWELLDTPLMLWVAMLAYRDAPVELSIEANFEQRRRRLFANFIDAMFKRRSSETRYTQQQTLSWLCWLAGALTRAKQTVFYLENLREEWLPSGRERRLSKAWVVLACGVVGGLVACLMAFVELLVTFGLNFDWTVDLMVALVFGLSFRADRRADWQFMNAPTG